jgi:hypothetical protein
MTKKMKKNENIGQNLKLIFPQPGGGKNFTPSLSLMYFILFFIDT